MLSRSLALAGTFFGTMVVAVACSSSYGADAPSTGVDTASDAAQDSPDGSEPEASTSDASEAGTLPTPTVLASGFVDLAGVAADETTVYVTERTAGRIRSVPLAGGAFSDVQNNGGALSRIVLAGPNLFWVNDADNTISRRTLPGGSVTSVTSDPGFGPIALAGSADHIAFAATGVGGLGQLVQYRLDFMGSSTLSLSGDPFDVGLHASDTFVTEVASGVISRTQLAPAAVMVVASQEADCQSLAVDASGVYWARPSLGLVRALLDQSAGAVSLATGQKSPFALAADTSGVYWMTADGTIRRSNHDELPPLLVAKGFDSAFTDRHVHAIALTSQYVVWITNDGKVLRLDK